jgi:hypothetical protein
MSSANHVREPLARGAAHRRGGGDGGLVFGDLGRVAGVDAQHGAQTGHIVLEGAVEGHMGGVEDQVGRARVVEDVGDLGRGEALVERHQHGARLLDGEVRLQVLMPVLHHDAGAVARRQADRRQSAGEAVDALAQLRVGEARAPVHDRLFVRIEPAGAVKHLMDEHGGASSRTMRGPIIAVALGARLVATHTPSEACYDN